MNIIKIEEIEYEYNDYGQNFNWKIDSEVVGNVTKLNISVDFLKEVQPNKISIEFMIPAIGADGVWSACNGVDRILRPDWGPTEVRSRLASGTPILSVFSENDQNVVTLSLNDGEIPCALKAGYREEKSILILRVEWFVDISEKAHGYSTTLTIDQRQIKFYDCIKDAAEVLRKKYKVIKAPTQARLPIFSTWYCMHQELTYERILTECKLAKELGMETVIIDDGWQTADSSRGYAYCGEYQPEPLKVGDICKLTDEIHKLGMKVMLWYPLPFSGDFSSRGDEFKDMLLYHDDSMRAGILDPRFKKVREYISDYSTQAVREWGFDGVKLDFMDAFRLTKESSIREGIDFQSLETGVLQLIDDIKDKLYEVNDEPLVEFRQTYIGAPVQRLGNMIRVGDCPGSLLINRLSSIDLRLIAGVDGTAVHSDPIEWNDNETDENMAKILINTLFSTLQLSVLPSEMTERTRCICKYFIGFMKEYLDVLQCGQFEPCGALHNYLSCTASNENTEIIGIYSPVVVKLAKDKTIVFNGGTSNEVVFSSETEYVYEIKNMYGESIEQGVINGLKMINAPIGSSVYFTK